MIGRPPPENACTAVGEGQEEVEQADGPGVGHAVGDDLRAAVEGGNQQGREDEDAQPDGLGQQGTAQQPEPDAGAKDDRSRAPMFWLTKVARAMEKQETGKKAKPSILL